MSMSIVKIVVDIVSLLTRFNLLSIAAVFVIEFVQPVAKTFSPPQSPSVSAPISHQDQYH